MGEYSDDIDENIFICCVFIPAYTSSSYPVTMDIWGL